MPSWRAASATEIPAFAANQSAAVGTVTESVNSPASITRSKSTLPGGKGTGVEMNDTVNTARGKTGITFVDDTKVEINENSKLVIDDFVFDPKSKDSSKLGMKVALGTVRYASGAIAHNNPRAVAINTPSATIGVRGTDFTATVDELGESTIILLPSCPQGYVDIEKDCKTGAIEVSNEAGSVLLNRPFEGTKVTSRNSAPLKPTILNLTPDAISNLLILSPPKELRTSKDSDQKHIGAQDGNMLAVDFLKQDFLKNELTSNDLWGENPLERPLLEQTFLDNIFSILTRQLRASETALLGNALTVDPVLPDYVKDLGVVAYKSSSTIELIRDTGSDVQSVIVSRFENNVVYMTINDNTIKNRINSGNSSVIRLIQK